MMERLVFLAKLVYVAKLAFQGFQENREALDKR